MKSATYKHATGTHCGRPAPSAGFTLLEVLITSVLLATLLAGIWGLCGMFADLYETGYIRTEKAQLIRSLVQQLSEDMASTVAPLPDVDKSANRRRGRVGGSSFMTAMSGAEGVASSADRVGFLGTYESLRLDILKTEPPLLLPAEPETPFDMSAETSNERSSEIVTVIYTFQSPFALDELIVLEPGLKRQEFGINESAELGDWGTASGLSDLSIDNSTERDWSDDSSTSDSRRQTTRFRIVTMRIPEVVALEFRYYDGRSWTDAWDSRIRQSLPLAVEVAMQIDFTGDVTRAIQEDPTSAPDAETKLEDSLLETTETDLFSETDEADPNQLPIHRFIIHLPQATKRKDVRSSRDSFEDAEFEEPGMGDMEIDDMEPAEWDDATGESEWREDE